MKRTLTLVALLACATPLLLAKLPANLYGRSATGTHGVVAAAKPDASQVGVNILKAGGNAVDAAIATGFALGVLEPNATGIGGGGFMIVRLANMKEAVVIDFREIAPKAATPDMYKFDEKGNVIDNATNVGGLASGTPGEVAGLLYAFEHFGSGKISRAQMLQPAIDWATKGYKCTANMSSFIKDHFDTIKKFPACAAIYLNKEPLAYLATTADAEQAITELQRTCSPANPDVVKFLDVEKLIILKGDISFDGLERTKSSYFKLRDIDFTIKGLAMKLPDKGKLNGSMQFDSVDLSVRPLRMIVMDSTYEVSCDNISLNSYPLNIHARGIRILPLEPSSGQSREKIRITATIPDMEISNFYFDRALFSGEWIIGGIRFSNLLAGIEMVRKNKPDGRGNQFPLALKFNPSLGTFRIDSICLENANIDIRINKGEKVSAYRLNDLRASFYRIAIDSLHQEGKPGTPLFNAGDISLSARGMNFLSDDSLYTFGFKRFRLSTGRKSLALDSLFYFPNYTDAEFYKKTGFQDDRYKISVPSLEFQNLDFGMLITDKAIRSGSLVVSGPRIETLRDKRVAGLRPGKRYLPQSQIKKIPIHVTIDSIFQKNGFAEYEEQTGDTPGRIFFDRMNSVVVNFSNEPGAWKQNPLITMEGTCRFMGKGKLGGQYFFDMLNPRDSLWWTGTVDSVDLRDINPMLSSLLPAKVIHGFVDNARFFVSANDNTATGSALVKYRDFYFEFDPLQKGFMKKWKNELITDVANTLVPDDNPEYKHKLRAGIVFFERDTTRGFFNYVWKSTLSGLKSTAGFNSRDQLQIKLKRPGKAK